MLFYLQLFNEWLQSRKAQWGGKRKRKHNSNSVYVSKHGQRKSPPELLPKEPPELLRRFGLKNKAPVKDELLKACIQSAAADADGNVDPQLLARAIGAGYSKYFVLGKVEEHLESIKDTKPPAAKKAKTISQRPGLGLGLMRKPQDAQYMDPPPAAMDVAEVVHQPMATTKRLNHGPTTTEQHLEQVPPARKAIAKEDEGSSKESAVLRPNTKVKVTNEDLVESTLPRDNVFEVPKEDKVSYNC